MTDPIRRDDAALERRRAVTVLLAAMIGVLSLLAFAGAADWLAALAAAAAVTAVAFLYLALSAQPRRARPGQTAAVGATLGDQRLSSDMMERLPDPVLLISETGRIDAANAAGRAFFMLGAALPMLSSVLRDAVVLEAVRAGFDASSPSSVTFDTPAPHHRHMRALITRLGVTEDARVMLVLHDETDAKRAERARADFLANASHQLRTPLASLSGFIDTLSGHAHDDEAARTRFLAIMREQADRMRQLIDDLLTLSRIELSEHVPPTGVADLATIAGDVADALAPVAQNLGVTVHIRCEVGRAMVRGDREDLVQVVQNLADNAVKYSRPGGEVTIAIGCGAGREDAAFASTRLSDASERMAILSPPRAGSDRYAWLRVRDDGPGVARRHLPRLSERFYRAGEEERSKRGGTGLGLAIVKHIMSRHRGGFTIESEPGHGSLFSVYVEEAPARTEQ